MIKLAEINWGSKEQVKPALTVLEVRDKDDPKGPPIVWVYLQRSEKYEWDNPDSVYEASIRIYFQFFVDRREHDPYSNAGYFCGSYSKFHNLVSLTSMNAGLSGAIFLDLPKSQRIGTYLMSEIVAWVKRWPEAEVNEVCLLEGQAHNDNKVRRNKFYENIGLEFKYEDEGSKKTGKSKPMLARDLIVRESWKENITELHPVSFAAAQCERIMDLEFEILSWKAANHRDAAELKVYYDKPLFSFMNTLWIKYRERLTMLMMSSVIGLIAWFK